jgi:hypothetical protein
VKQTVALKFLPPKKLRTKINRKCNYISSADENIAVKLSFKSYKKSIHGARGSVVGSANMLQGGRSRVRFPMR